MGERARVEHCCRGVSRGSGDQVEGFGRWRGDGLGPVAGKELWSMTVATTW